ncbi:MAG: DUF368 domain-containing protein [Treponemataceae bacterium]|nr:DUF368 domain-containing protein [Treponemataceae bacterium]
MAETIKLIGIGIVLGIANVVPGVSGGTIAVAFGIYGRLIRVITIKVRTILSEWKFLLPLAVGMLAGIFLCSSFISFLFGRFPIQTNWFFIGIILGSIPMLYVRMSAPAAASSGAPEGAGMDAHGDASAPEVPPASGDDGRRGGRTVPLPKPSAALCCLAALAVMAGVLCVQKKLGGAPSGAETAFSFGLAVKVFLGLAVAAAAMIIPGISGSFLMLVIGVYGTIVTAVAERNIPLLVPGALGAVAGLLGGALLVRILLARVPAQTYGAIMGLVIGSVCVLFPGFGSAAVAAVSLLCAAAGFAVSFAAGRKQRLD